MRREKVRSVVIDALSGKQILAGAEERDATQPFVFYLTQRLGWHTSADRHSSAVARAEVPFST